MGRDPWPWSSGGGCERERHSPYRRDNLAKPVEPRHQRCLQLAPTARVGDRMAAAVCWAVPSLPASSTAYRIFTPNQIRILGISFSAGEDAMPKNILIFSDGTGQAGKLTPDENVSNIYKLYRATRCGPESDIDPKEQLTFYDPGLGSEPGNGVFSVERAYRWIHNVVSQATGLGITMNIVDCYAAILRMWQPGDRIFLFGFSRGAYTVRCVAAVLSLCGVPTTNAYGKTPLFRDSGTTRKIAKEAVKKAYQHVSSQRDSAYLEQRKALALRFRQKYHSDANGASNVHAFFIGVFDTVAD